MNAISPPTRFRRPAPFRFYSQSRSKGHGRRRSKSPAAGRRFARNPEQMAVFAVVVGILAAVGGLAGSLAWDTPSGPSVVVAALALFLLSLAAGGRTRFARPPPD